MRTLEIDLETFSSADLKKCGVHRYVEAPDFEILLFGYAVNDGPVRVINLVSGEQIPDDVLSALTDPMVIKCAWNAQFERVCLSRCLGVRLDPDSWRCTMVWAATLGLPLSLEQAGAVLGLEQQKLKEGNAEKGYLRDVTGNRRFWPVKTPGSGKRQSWQLTQDEVLQIWAEALTYVKAGELLYLDAAMDALAKDEQREAMEADEREGLVRDYLDTLLPEDWAKMDTYERHNFLSGGEFGGSTRVGTVKRLSVSNIGVHQGGGAGYAQPVEFGHGGPAPAPPHPFVRPAYDAESETAYETMKRELRAAIDRRT